MNIAYFCDISSIHNLKWINYFSKNNNVILITDKKHINKNYYENSNVKIYYLIPETYPLLRGFVAKKRTLTEIRKIISENKIDIIHSLYAVPYSFWAYKLNFQKHIITTRGSDVLVDYAQTFNNYKNIKEQVSKRILKKLFQNTLKKGNFITSTSTKQQEVIQKFIDNPDKLVLIRTGVDVDFFESNYTLLKKTTPPEQITILSPRLIKPLYNIDIIIKAFNKIVHDFNKLNFKLVLINYFANPEYLASIKTQIKNSNLEKYIDILNAQDQLGMLQQYKNADLVVMLPSSDGVPVSGIETMLAKKPLLLGNIQYDSDIFNTHTTWKVNTQSPEEIANKILEILHLPKKELDTKMEKAFYAVSEKANFKKEIYKLEGIYSSLYKG